MSEVKPLSVCIFRTVIHHTLFCEHILQKGSKLFFIYSSIEEHFTKVPGGGLSNAKKLVNERANGSYYYKYGELTIFMEKCIRESDILYVQCETYLQAYKVWGNPGARKPFVLLNDACSYQDIEIVINKCNALKKEGWKDCTPDALFACKDKSNDCHKYFGTKCKYVDTYDEVLFCINTATKNRKNAKNFLINVKR